MAQRQMEQKEQLRELPQVEKLRPEGTVDILKTIPQKTENAKQVAFTGMEAQMLVQKLQPLVTTMLNKINPEQKA
jgi:hypothetical protein